MKSLQVAVVFLSLAIPVAVGCSSEPTEATGSSASPLVSGVGRIVANQQRALVHVEHGKSLSELFMYTDGKNIRYGLTLDPGTSRAKHLGYSGPSDGSTARLSVAHAGRAVWSGSNHEIPVELKATFARANRELSYFFKEMKDVPAVGAHYNGLRLEESSPSPTSGGGIRPMDTCSDVCSVITTLSCWLATDGTGGLVCGLVSIPVCHAVCDVPQGTRNGTPCGSGTCDGLKTCTSCQTDCGNCRPTGVGGEVPCQPDDPSKPYPCQ